MTVGSDACGGVNTIVSIEGIMNQYQYESILENVMEPNSFGSLPVNYFFQHDNDSKYTSRLVKC